MDNNIETTTEEKIMEAAISIFQQDGYSGARMQAIADLAGINKAMLHYYFRSKDLLFLKVLETRISKIMPQIELSIIEEMTVEDILYRITDIYLDNFKETPYLPGMVICTFNHNPELVKNIKIKGPKALIQRLQQAVEEGEICPVDPIQVITTVISLCLAPYAAKPMMMHVLGLNEKHFAQMMEQKRDYIKFLIRQMIHT